MINFIWCYFRIIKIMYSKTIERMLLVAPWGKDQITDDYVHPSLGIYRIKFALSEMGVNCSIFDPNLAEDSHQELRSLIGASKFDMVGFSSNHYTLPHDLSLMHLVYNLKKDMFLVGGGVECTTNYETVLQYAPPGFIIVRGEGEITLQEFCKQPVKEKVPGLIWMENGNLCFSPSRPNLSKDEFIHFTRIMDWKKVPFEDYWRFLGSIDYDTNEDPKLAEKNIKTARLVLSNHCPRNCNFCSSTNFLRIASGENPKVHKILSEEALDVVIDICNAHSELKTIFFHDDDFLANKRWTKSFCELAIGAKESGILPNDLCFIAQGSVRNVPYLSPYLADLGFKLVGLGVESFSMDVLREFNKVQSEAEINNAITSLLDVDVIPYLNLILSSPDSTVDDLRLTVNESIKYLKMGASIATSLYTLAFPGAKIISETQKEGLITYQSHNIEGTPHCIQLSDKILPRDPTLREVLRRTEIRIPEILKTFFPQKKRFRSVLGPATLYAILDVIKEMELQEVDDNLKETEGILCSMD